MAHNLDSHTLAWPVRIEGGQYAQVNAASDDGQTQHVAVMLATTPRQRVAVPDYGVPDSVGVRDFDEQAVLAAASRWCPAAEIVGIDAALSVQADRTLEVNVSVRRRT